MPIPGLTAFSIKLALDWLGPIVLRRVRRAIEEADGKFKSDARRRKYVRKQFEKVLEEENKLYRTKRGFRETVQHLLVEEWRTGRGIPGFNLLPPPA